MAVSQSYREFVLEQLGRVTPVTGKSMFGGVGICAQGLFFALIAEHRLYFKVDHATRPEFEKRGMEPFRPFGEDSAMASTCSKRLPSKTTARSGASSFHWAG